MALPSSDVFACFTFVSVKKNMVMTNAIATLPFRVQKMMEYGAISVADRSRTVEDGSDEMIIDADEGPKVNDVLWYI